MVTSGQTNHIIHSFPAPWLWSYTLKSRLLPHIEQSRSGFKLSCTECFSLMLPGDQDEYAFLSLGIIDHWRWGGGTGDEERVDSVQMVVIGVYIMYPRNVHMHVRGWSIKPCAGTSCPIWSPQWDFWLASELKNTRMGRGYVMWQLQVGSSDHCWRSAQELGTSWREQGSLWHRIRSFP